MNYTAERATYTEANTEEKEKKKKL